MKKEKLGLEEQSVGISCSHELQTNEQECGFLVFPRLPHYPTL